MLKSIAALAIAMVIPATVLAEAPATQPAPQAVASTEAKVLIVPFTPVEATDPDWIGRAVQQSLLADLSRSNGSISIQPTSDASRIASVPEALEVGRKAGARYVIFGTYQRIDPSLRITGQVVDVTSGKVVAGLKATGSERDLFSMQDTLAFQAKWGLGTERLAERTAAKQADAAAVEKPEIQPQGPVVMAGERYADSELSRAVADGRSLIERNDAAGSSYRENYYDGYNIPAGYGYGHGLNYPYFWNNYYPYDGWWWGRRTVIINGGHHHGGDCNHSGGSVQGRPDRFPFSGSVPTVGTRDYSIGVGNTMGSYQMTMQGAARNYIGPIPGPSHQGSVSSGVTRGQTTGVRAVSTPRPVSSPRPVRQPMTTAKPAK